MFLYFPSTCSRSAAKSTHYLYNESDISPYSHDNLLIIAADHPQKIIKDYKMVYL